MLTCWHDLILAGSACWVNSSSLSPLVLAKKCSWCPISLRGFSVPGHSRATPCFTPYKSLLQNLLVVLLSSVKWALSSFFGEGSELFVSIVFPQEWCRIEMHIAVPHRDEGHPKWKLHFHSSLSPSNLALVPGYCFPSCTNSLENRFGAKRVENFFFSFLILGKE